MLFRALLVVQLIQEIQKENKEQQVDEAGIEEVVRYEGHCFWNAYMYLNNHL